MVEEQTLLINTQWIKAGFSAALVCYQRFQKLEHHCDRARLRFQNKCFRTQKLQTLTLCERDMKSLILKKVKRVEFLRDFIYYKSAQLLMGRSKLEIQDIKISLEC